MPCPGALNGNDAEELEAMTRQQAVEAIRRTTENPAASNKLRNLCLRWFIDRDPCDAAADLEHAARLFRDLSNATQVLPLAPLVKHRLA